MTTTPTHVRLSCNWGRVAARYLVLGALAALPVPVGAQSRSDQSDPPDVRTAATAERSVQPDLALVTLQFFAQGATPSEAGRRLAARADSLRRALATLGIPRDSLVNRSRWYWWPRRMETVPLPVRYVRRETVAPDGRHSDAVYDTVYRAHEAIEVRIRDLSKVGPVLDTAMGRRITDMGMQFTATNVAAAQDEALRDATLRARRQAETIAAASGMALGPVLWLSTQPDHRYEYSPFQLRGTVSLSGTLDQGNAGTAIVQPSVPVSVTVYGRWALVRKP